MGACCVQGVTIVVTPLLSLMSDQLRALLQLPGGGVGATFLSSQITHEARLRVFRELRKPHPTVKLVYTTPEQLKASEGLNGVMEDLHSKKMLDRFVVDEVWRCLRL
jgi:superfamily II DNA helicase RecQ